MLSLPINISSGQLFTKSSSSDATGKKLSSAPDARPPVEEDVPPALGGAAARRRLRHIQQIALRGLDFEAAICNGFFLEILGEDEEEEQPPLERSDLLRTRNPTWAPVCGIRRGKNLSAFELRVVDAVEGQTYWRSIIRLEELEPLGEELEDISETLPPAVPMLRLGDKWYSLPGIAPLAASQMAQTPERRRAPVVKQIQASQICEAGESISTMLSRLKNLSTSSNTLRQAMEGTIAQGRALHERRDRRASCEQRVRELRREAERRKHALSQLRERLNETQASQESQASRLQQQRTRLISAEQEHNASAASLPTVYSGLRTLWQQLRCRRIRMLHEVCQVYPIENCGTYRTIRGLCVAEIRQLSRVDLREEENISTALGYLSHLLVTLASILEVPLRIRVHHAGCSRSFLSDPHESPDMTTPPREFPLYYGRGLEKSRFMDALRLLRDGLHQFLYSRGYFDEKRAGVGNLLECFELIIQKEMHGID